MKRMGIDISKWQGNYTIPDAAEFVIIKAGGSDDGLYIDSQFLSNYINCKNRDIPCGIYWYTAAASVEALDTEIDYLIGHIMGLQFELPIYLDLEEEELYFYSNDLAVHWLEKMYASGYYPGIYCGYSWSNDQLIDNIIGTFPFWLAYWADEKPDFKWKYGIWQKGSCYINGIVVDIDYQYIDYEPTIKELGLNGYKPQKQRFIDVTKDKSYYKAVQWAASNGYIKGYKDGTFRPDEPMTRAQVQVELWRMAGKPEV